MLLEPQPELRPTAAEVLNLPWLRSQVEGEGWPVIFARCILSLRVGGWEGGLDRDGITYSVSIRF